MKKIRDVTTALEIFEEAASEHAEATKTGDYNRGNKNYEKLIKVTSYLKEQDHLDELLQYLTHDAVGIRLAAATFLLPKYESEGMEVLDKISKSTDFFSFVAETTLSEWRIGNLKL